MLAKPPVLAVPVEERFSVWVTHCPWAFILHIEDVFRVTKQYVNIENRLLVLSKAPIMSVLGLGNGWVFLISPASGYVSGEGVGVLRPRRGW